MAFCIAEAVVEMALALLLSTFDAEHEIVREFVRVGAAGRDLALDVGI